MKIFYNARLLKLIALLPATFFYLLACSQATIDLSDFNAFQSPASNWHIAGDVHAPFDKERQIVYSGGKGILVNDPVKDAQPKDLLFNLRHGDIDLQLDFMMAKGSNSGVYLQGRYEVQLLDSWGITNPKSSDVGGIYERWDESRPDGKKGYEGYAPRQNAGKAPGTWQHLKISFQAPRFADGKKIANAKFLRVELNGVLIQENVELSGVTRGAIDTQEVAFGPLRLQGDHGPVAFRNIVYENYDKEKPSTGPVKYSLYGGHFLKEPDYKKLKPISEGVLPQLTSVISGLPDNEFLVKYSGTIDIKEAGEYTFTTGTSGGFGLLSINGDSIIPLTDWRASGKKILQPGTATYQLTYSKTIDWAKPLVALSVKGPGFRDLLISDANISGVDIVDPILINAESNTILRSFVDIPGSGRVVHAVSVGSPLKVNYTYDMDNGMIVQLWHGNFLDATPMWHERGDGSSRPAGSVQYFGKPQKFLQHLPSADAPWPSDTAGSGYRPKGYFLDDQDRPSFKYYIYGDTIIDAIRVLENGYGIQRQITINKGGNDLYVRLAEASSIEMLSDDLYLLDDKSYYIRLDDAGNNKPVIRDINGRKELIIPVQQSLHYSILF